MHHLFKCALKSTCSITCSCDYLLICQLYTSISCISVVTVVLMLMHVGCRTMKCGSMTCRIYDGTCDGGQILEIESMLYFYNVLQTAAILIEEINVGTTLCRAN